MRHPPQWQSEKADGVSPFVAKAIADLALPGPCDILDLPCGFGRHSIWLARLGHRMTAADIDRSRIESFTSISDTTGQDNIRGTVINATESLPFVPGSFDGVVIVDYVSEILLAQVGSILRPGGFLIYETFSARGMNWQKLLPPGRTAKILGSSFQFTQLSRKPVGPNSCAETVKLVGESLPYAIDHRQILA